MTTFRIGRSAQKGKNDGAADTFIRQIADAMDVFYQAG